MKKKKESCHVLIGPSRSRYMELCTHVFYNMWGNSVDVFREYFKKAYMSIYLKTLRFGDTGRSNLRRSSTIKLYKIIRLFLNIKCLLLFFDYPRSISAVVNNCFMIFFNIFSKRGLLKKNCSKKFPHSLPCLFNKT